MFQALVIGTGWLLATRDTVSTTTILIAMYVLSVCGSVLFARFASHASAEPIHMIWQAVQHIAPHGEPQPSPNIDSLQYGRELVSNLVNHVYQMASVVSDVEKTNAKKIQDIHANFLANSLPLPVVVLDKDDNIVYTNEAAIQYFARPVDELETKNLYTALDMAFSDDQTLHSWLQTVRRSSVTASMRWERVRIGLPGQKDTKQFDLAAHFNSDNPMGYETLLILFDHTEVYSQDDQAMSFVALTVHELRTPLTLLRGYIEVFDEELGPSLSAELKDFMKKWMPVLSSSPHSSTTS
ncbi:PAS domain-containing protein [Candidatus Saccharibacteria bacterium]|nr:MAG: PAS domain-containing protein [Candidatus Saccharibacteria bacterium]